MSVGGISIEGGVQGCVSLFVSEGQVHASIQHPFNGSFCAYVDRVYYPATTAKTVNAFWESIHLLSEAF